VRISLIFVFLINLKNISKFIKTTDTAQVYKNESDIGRSLEILLPKYNLSRKDIFIITKIGTAKYFQAFSQINRYQLIFVLAPYNQGEIKSLDSIKNSLKSLCVDYIDLVLIHWPGAKGFKLDDTIHLKLRIETWQALEAAYEQGLVKSIGVSNYNIRQLNELINYSTVKPHWLQVDRMQNRNKNLYGKPKYI